MELELQDRLRSVFFKWVSADQQTDATRLLSSYLVHSSLLADPKARKVIVIEPPLLPLAVKDMFARILFNNLEVRLFCRQRHY